MCLHQRRERTQLGPADEQLRLAALGKAAAEVAPDVVGEVREPRGGAGEQRGEQRPERPEVGGLVAAPEHPGGLLTGPSGAAEDHTAALAVDVVECLLGRLAIEPPVLPGGLDASATVGELRIRGEVVALAVVGLHALDSQLEDVAGELAPPVSRSGGGEVDDRAGPHPPAADVRVAVRGLDVVARLGPLGVVLGRLGVEPLGLGVRRALAVDRFQVDPGVTQTTVRTPSSRIPLTSPGASGNWWGLKRQVLYCVSQGESITIASSGSSDLR